MRFLLPFLFLTTAVAGTALAQVPGEFVTGGIGCNRVAVSQNDPVPGFTPRSLPNEYAHGAILPNGGTVGAVSFYTESVNGGLEVIQAGIYLSSNGSDPDVNPVAVCRFRVGGALGWYTASFDVPVTVSPNTLFFVAADANAVRPPDAGPAGVTPVTNSFYRRPPFGGTGWTSTVIVDSPIYRVHTIDGPSSVDTLTSNGVPTIGNPFDFLVYGAPSGTPALITFATTEIAVDLGPLGAPNCTLRTDPLVHLVSPSAPATGPATLTVSVPNLNVLIGAEIYHQGLIPDPSANALGFDLTNLARTTIGG